MLPVLQTIAILNDKRAGRRFQSNAKWPEGQYPFGNDVSTDLHDSHLAASCVCEALMREGWGGERKVFPLKTWVSEVKEPTND